MPIDEFLPRHGHRSPAELAEDEILAAMRGDGPTCPNRLRYTPERREAVTLDSSRLFPVRKADCVSLGREEK
jgi:hypothetical protein